MKYSLKEASARHIGSELTIYDIFTDSKANMDFVIAELDGDHPMIINHVSDRIYYIICGIGEVYSDNQWDAVSEGDCVYIKKNTAHSIRGNLKYAIITSPPFNSKNESEFKK